MLCPKVGGGHKPTCAPTFESGEARAPLPPFSYALAKVIKIIIHCLLLFYNIIRGNNINIRMVQIRKKHRKMCNMRKACVFLKRMLNYVKRMVNVYIHWGTFYASQVTYVKRALCKAYNFTRTCVNVYLEKIF